MPGLRTGRVSIWMQRKIHVEKQWKRSWRECGKLWMLGQRVLVCFFNYVKNTEYSLAVKDSIQMMLKEPLSTLRSHPSPPYRGNTIISSATTLLPGFMWQVETHGHFLCPNREQSQRWAGDVKNGIMQGMRWKSRNGVRGKRVSTQAWRWHSDWQMETETEGDRPRAERRIYGKIL